MDTLLESWFVLMMDLRCVAFFLGNLLLVLAAATTIPAGAAWYLGEVELHAFVYSASSSRS